MPNPIFYRTPDEALPLELGDPPPQTLGLDEAKAQLVIGICHRCGRRGLLRKDTRNCTGYRAVTVGLVQVPQARQVRCQKLGLRKAMRRRPKGTIKLPRRDA